MGRADESHFDEYRHQNRVKHSILTKYLSGYLNVMKGWQSDSIFFIDGFAGRGHYDDPDSGNSFAGSPILALQEIFKLGNKMSKIQAWFIEVNGEYFANLESSVESFLKTNKGVKRPILTHGGFTSVLQPILSEIDGEGNDIKPTLLFVDPCGVDDVSLDVISTVVRSPGCEAFIFFNYVGVNRICGLLKTVRETPSLVSLLGNQERVDQLAIALKACNDANDRERAIVSAYLEAIRADGCAEYLIPFRVEDEKKQTTSHYFVHASKHHLGFKIMKDIMWEMGRGTADEGRLELLQASGDEQHSLLRADLAALDAAVLKHLATVQSEVVSTFLDEWVQRSSDMFSESCYRRRLLDLESKGHIEVVEEDGITIKPPSKRLRMNPREGRKLPTLGKKLRVRLPK